ncbi:MAG: glycosyltransferase family 4 protein [Elusimicrobiota bacterium]|jgi:glycosyltransferase involved in cell wall biosynthesis
MKKILFIGAHLGYPMDRTPLGGGAMVGLELLRHWGASGRAEIHALGPGSFAPEGAKYHRVETVSGDRDPELTGFSELGYARFCRSFEHAATRFLLKNKEAFSPEETVLVVNDISESPDLRVLSREGWRILTLWHVDVVDFFNRMYLGGRFSVERAAGLYKRCEALGLKRFLPDMLRLVFEKQKAAVEVSHRLVMPSSGMARTLLRAYPDAPSRQAPLQERIKVLPWGAWTPEVHGGGADASSLERFKRHFNIGPRTRVVMTLSRISPEKGLHRLLEAFSLMEKGSPHDLCLFLCGDAAYMGGGAYLRALRRQAAGLRRTRIFFPGYLSAPQKGMFFRAAHLFVSASRHESYGLTITEAMRAGLPVLSCAHYGAAQILKEDYARVVPSEGDSAVEGLSRGLRELLSDMERLQAMGLRAKEASARMEFSHCAGRLLDEALAERSSSAGM